MITIGDLRQRLRLIDESLDHLPVTFAMGDEPSRPIEDAGYSLSRGDGGMGNYEPAEFLIMLPKDGCVVRRR